jgi:hypothetical protein
MKNQRTQQSLKDPHDNVPGWARFAGEMWTRSVVDVIAVMAVAVAAVARLQAYFIGTLLLLLDDDGTGGELLAAS